MSTTEPTTEAGRDFLTVHWNNRRSAVKLIDYAEAHRAVRAIEAEKAEAALSQFTPERISEVLGGFALGDGDGEAVVAWMAMRADGGLSHVANELLAATLYAALTEKPQETPE